MTFRDLELIAFLTASLVHGSQGVLVGRYARSIQGLEKAEARKGLVSIGLIFLWQFSNFVCVLLATVGLGYPSLPSKLCNLVRWGSLYSFPIMLSYVVTHLRFYGRPTHPVLVKIVTALRYLLWPWMIVALVSLVAEGTGLFTPLVSHTLAGTVTLILMLVFFVVMTIQGLQLRRDMGPSPLGRARRAGLISSGISAIFLVLYLFGLHGAMARLSPYIGLASMMTTVPVSIYLAYRYHQFPFMDVFIRQSVTGMVLAIGFTISMATSPLFPSELRVLWITMSAIALAFVKGPLSRVVERQLLGYDETVEEQEERLGGSLRALTELDSFPIRAENILRTELEAEWVAIENKTRPDAVHQFELKASVPGWLMLGPRTGKRAYMSRQLRLARSAALQLAAQQEWLYHQENNNRRLVEQHQLRELTARAEIRALQAQINPHFLFNTLNVLANLIQDNPDRAERVTEQLAEVFRYALESTRRERVSLEEEVRFLQAYLDIERARFGERLRHHWTLDSGVEKVQIAPMLLQPLVENAVRHGIAPALRGGELWIHAMVNTNQLVLQVEDSGVGLFARSSNPGLGVGLNNVRERLRHCYGEGADLILEAREPEGTRVTLLLPVELAQEAISTSRQEVPR